MKVNSFSDVDRELDKLRTSRVAITDGHLLEDVQLTSGTTVKVPHKLGRRLQGYLVVKTNAGAALGFIYDEQLTTAGVDKFLYLRAEGYSPKVSLWVF